MPYVFDISGLHEYLAGYVSFDSETSEQKFLNTSVQEISGCKAYFNSFWTARQRQASSIHEISYRACFKPQLPRFFIELFTKKGDIVYDPFTGRGTTPVEAGLLGRRVISNDINPLSRILCEPRFFVPDALSVKRRFDDIEYDGSCCAEIDLSMFYEKKTESEVVSLKNYLYERKKSGEEDYIDKWIRMAATNRLTGHSKGFFSVYTLPPNQAVSQQSQIKINEKKNQTPEYRDTKKLILKKTKALLKTLSEDEIRDLSYAGENSQFLQSDAAETKEISDESVSLTVTSPPFLDIVQYASDNWLRCWFNSLDAQGIARKITMSRTVPLWTDAMQKVFFELYRVTKPGGWVAFEVGEVRNKKVCLDEHVIPIGKKAGFECAAVLINEQNFTKTSNIWGIENKKRGTNTNRVVIFKKED